MTEEMQPASIADNEMKVFAEAGTVVQEKQGAAGGGFGSVSGRPPGSANSPTVQEKLAEAEYGRDDAATDSAAAGPYPRRPIHPVLKCRFVPSVVGD